MIPGRYGRAGNGFVSLIWKGIKMPRPKPVLTDAHGRRIHKVRVQITDACNFRCFYCMPPDVEFTPSRQLLSTFEIIDICSALVNLGINEIRISGGEPTLRKDMPAIIEGLSALNLLKLGLTSNAYFLAKKLSFLKTTQCRHINISLDSLNADCFKFITRTDYFDTVFQTILKTKEMGFQVKVNVVLMRGVNDMEVFDFIKFSAKYGIEVRFLELMKIGQGHARHEQLFISAHEIIQRIEEKEKLTPQSVNCDSTSFNFMTSSEAQIGFIASESQPFCQFCSRLRLTAIGILRACLMSEKGINLRHQDKADFPNILKNVMSMKPTGRIDHINQPMYQIGG